MSGNVTSDMYAQSNCESSLGAKFLHADNEDFKQTARMRRPSRVFVWRTCQKVRFLTLMLNCLA